MGEHTTVYYKELPNHANKKYKYTCGNAQFLERKNVNANS
jgi:hypothetical protein